jgi:hypothetical protein
MDFIIKKHLDTIKEDNPYAFFYRNATQLPYQCTRFYQLKFAQQILATVEVLTKQYHDVDSVKFLLAQTVETLFLALSRTGISNIYTPPLLYQEFKRNPAEVVESYSHTSQKLLQCMASQTSKSRIDELADLLEQVEKFVDETLQLGGFKTFEHLVYQHFEMKMHWANIKAERDELIRKKPFLRYQLESTSVFPLKYIIGYESVKLRELLQLGQVNQVPCYPLTIEEIKRMLVKAVTNMIRKQNKTHAEVRKLLSQYINSVDSEVEFTNLCSLLLPILKYIAIPTFVQTWERTHHSSFALRQMLRGEVVEEEYVQVDIPDPLPAAQDQRETHREENVNPVDIPVENLPLHGDIPVENPPPPTPADDINQPDTSRVFTPLHNFNYVEVVTDKSTPSPLRYRVMRKIPTRKKLIFNLTGEEYTEQENSPSAAFRPIVRTPILITNQPTAGGVSYNNSDKIAPQFVSPNSEEDTLEKFLGICQSRFYSPLTPY